MQSWNVHCKAREGADEAGGVFVGRFFPPTAGSHQPQGLSVGALAWGSLWPLRAAKFLELGPSLN